MNMLWLNLFSAISIYFVFNASVISIGRAGAKRTPTRWKFTARAFIFESKPGETPVMISGIDP
jgi:hypothetical protein